MLTATDVSCLMIPDGCIGIPTLAALKTGIDPASNRRPLDETRYSKA
ncbi:MAG: hypothetical protein P8Z75_16575 [Gammaproteobacteria bacterium]